MSSLAHARSVAEAEAELSLFPVDSLDRHWQYHREQRLWSKARWRAKAETACIIDQFTSKLAVALAKYAPDADDIVRQSVEAIRDQPVDIQPGIKEAYAEALTYVFLIGIPLGFCCSLFALLVRNKSIKGQTLAMAG